MKNNIITLLCCMVLSAQYSFVNAQTAMQIWKGGSVIQAYNIDDVDSITFRTGIVYDNSKVISGHRFVDLGLPSGLLWAETNIGAETAADIGNYYAWGETEPQSSNSYSWSSYKHGANTSNLTKYNASDRKTTLDNEDDAAYVNWGSFCRMPTDDDISELLNTSNCTWTWTSMTASDGSSVKGYKVTSIMNGNSIFLPASGCRINGNLYNRDLYGDYWSNTLYSRGSYRAYYIYFGSSNIYKAYQDRYDGHVIRPVAEP